MIKIIQNQGKKTKVAATPSCSYNKEKQEKNIIEEDEKNKMNNNKSNTDKNSGEIGERLTKYIFGFDKIVIIPYIDAEIFKDYILKDDNEINSLKKIISKEDTSYAKFTCTTISGIVHKIDDCRVYPYNFVN